MKNILYIFCLLCSIAQAQTGGYLKPRYLGWPPVPYDSSKMYSLQLNPVTKTGYWAESGSIANFYTLPPDSICVISSGDTICVANDSVTVTSGQICVTQMGVTTCVGGGSGNIYNSDGTVTASTNRVLTLPSTSTIAFKESGSTEFFKCYPVGDSTVFRKDLKIRASLRDYYNSVGTTNQVLANDGGGHVQWASLAGIYTVKLNELAASSNVTYPLIDNGVTKIRWGWNSITNDTALLLKTASMSSGSLLALQIASTAAASNTQKGLDISLSGANTNISQTTYGVYVSNAHTGTSRKNIGAYINVTGSLSKGISSNSDLGIGIESISGGTGIYSSSTSSSSSVYSGVIEKNVAGTLLTRPLQISTINSSGVGGVGDLNTGIDLAIEPATGGVAVLANSITSEWSVATNASRSSLFKINGYFGGTLGDIMILGDDGGVTGPGTAGTVRFPALPNTLDSGLPTNLLNTDNVGNVYSSPIRRINTNNVTSSTNVNLSNPGQYVNTSGAPTFSLPTVAASVTPNIYYIKNRSASTLTVDVVGGGTTIMPDNSTTAVASISVLTGAAIMIMCDGTYWNVYNN